MTKAIVFAVALSAGAMQAANVAGTWIILLEGHQVGLAIEQDDTKLTGTLQMRGRNIAVEGEMVERSFTLTAEGAHVSGHGETKTVPLKLAGKLKDDGTLEGEMDTARGPMRWTAERLKRPNAR